MRFAAIVLAVAGLAAAQTTTTSASSAISTSGCGTQIDTIIASCLGTENAQLNACAANDWDCLCEQSGNVNTCYNNCPSDPNAFGVKQQMISYCNAAKAYGTTTVVTATASMTSSTASSMTASSTSSGEASTTSDAAATKTSNAAGDLAPAVGLLAAVFGVAALL
ncbi:Hypothetical protein R9X50_00375600 [Acrodontium crateriforme]|uniref:GPI anchored serine-threonine rich protein n=1 Tax=Acrodontium crateriforme TaxID=150365 RepID=A0AAQ3M4S3_9PEZI|nr:Hypothetical protein R9X50_00375600 [Acrodontium crateriforme]